MVKKTDRRKRDIKSKLVAAICMLLVSSIMVVSSTYAWFTLSTAPEVKGITTAVGANGNLEMALQPLNGDSSKITSAVGDSMSVQNAYLANTTWGNLVDVSDNDFYGMKNIMLYPAKLNTTTVTYNGGNATGLATSPLAIPVYGSDGRVASLATNKTFTGVYDSTSKGFVNSITTTEGAKLEKLFGLRAVGTSSSMSDRQLAYRAALAAASTAMSQAKRAASQSLNNNGAALADIAIKHATSTNEKYSVAELLSLQTIVNELLGTDATTGSLEYIEEALIQYALASALANVASDDNYQNYVDAFNGATLDTLADVMSSNNVTNIAITDHIDELQTAISNVKAAKDILDNLLTNAASGATFEWENFDDALYKLADPDQMQVNGIAVTDLNKNWNVGADKYNAGAATEVTVLANGTTSTKSVSTYTSNGVEYYVDASGFVYEKDMDADTNAYPAVQNMARLVDAVLNDGIQLIIASGAGVFADIADFCGDYNASVTLSKISYGGMTVKNLDANMATKTSQTTPYLEQASEDVPKYSAGTSSSATSNITDFYGYIIDLAFRTNVADSSLMLQTDAVDRIYSDGTNVETMGGGASMTFKSTDASFSGAAVKNLMECIRIVFFDTDSGAIIGYARLDAATAGTGSDGSITMDLKMWDETNNNWASSAAIMALEQNTITELSALVYLDGEKVTNADVANAASSMTGSMNLQFSSSAELKPMDYSDLKNGTGETTTYNVTVNGTSAGAATAGASYSYTVADYANYTITVKMGGTDITSTCYDSSTGKITIDKVTGDIAVTATAVTP